MLAAFESTLEYFREIWDIPAARTVIYMAALSIAVVSAVYFAKLFRDMAIGSGEDVDHLSEFDQMRRDGTLGEFEFVRVKSKVGTEQRGKLGEMLGREVAGTAEQFTHPEQLTRASGEAETDELQPDFEELDDDDKNNDSV